jgi:DNA-binding NtrC family response regulator
MKRHQRRHGRAYESLSADALAYLEGQSWPGNIRELSHRLEAALILSDCRAPDVEALAAAKAMAEGWGEKGGPEETEGPLAFKEALALPTSDPVPGATRYSFLGTDAEEREAISLALARTRGNRTRAARELGMARNTLRNKMGKFGLG